MRLVSEAADVGESKIELPISYSGPEVSIMFDPRYIAEFLRVLEPGTPVRLQLIDSTSAVMLTTADGYLYVIMPLSRDRTGK
jgi:DNA polymerase-3 subunit beta